MKIEIHHYFHNNSELEKMSQQLDDIQREVQEAKDVQASAIALINGLRAKLDEMAANAVELADLKAQIASLSQDLSNSSDALAAAVGTPPTDPQPQP